MEGKTLACSLLLLFASSGMFARQVQIGVLGLFHPREVLLSAANGEALVVTAGESELVLEPGPRAEFARIAVSQGGLVLGFRGRLVHATEIHATGRGRRSVSFFLSVPGKISRKYQGTVAVKASDGEVAAIVTMDLETAVASVVAAESEPGTPLEALKAQAIVTRSYFLAGKGRHRDFDFCDATHCQFLREPPVPGSPAAVATLATRGLVILFDEKAVAAMFTRSCGGHTQTPAELGIPSRSYPYYSVLCDACYKSPVRWTRRISEEDAAQLLGKGEAGRLAVDRRLGWNTVPSNSFGAKPEGHEVVLEGKGQGHGIGLCQRGARAMSEGGANFRDILSHYFPNTTVGMSSDGSASPHAAGRWPSENKMKNEAAWRQNNAVLDCAAAYLSLGSPARLPRHIPRQTKRIITIPIIATPSFMPSQTGSNESTAHQPFSTVKTTGSAPLPGDAQSR